MSVCMKVMNVESSVRHWWWFSFRLHFQFRLCLCEFTPLLMSICACILPELLPLTSDGEFYEKACTKDRSTRGSRSALSITIQIVSKLYRSFRCDSAWDKIFQQKKIKVIHLQLSASICSLFSDSLTSEYERNFRVAQFYISKLCPCPISHYIIEKVIYFFARIYFFRE